MWSEQPSWKHLFFVLPHLDICLQKKVFQRGVLKVLGSVNGFLFIRRFTNEAIGFLVWGWWGAGPSGPIFWGTNWCRDCWEIIKIEKSLGCWDSVGVVGMMSVYFRRWPNVQCTRLYSLHPIGQICFSNPIPASKPKSPPLRLKFKSKGPNPSLKAQISALKPKFWPQSLNLSLTIHIPAHSPYSQPYG